MERTYPNPRVDVSDGIMSACVHTMIYPLTISKMEKYPRRRCYNTVFTFV